MLQFQAGDDSAFDRIILHYQEPVRRFIQRYVQDRDRGEDLCQEAFLRVYRARARYRPSATFRTWLFTIVTRLCLNDLRSRRRERRVIVPMPALKGSEEEGEEILNQAARHERDGALLDLSRRELEEAIDAAILALPPNQKAAILLLRFEELSYQEIAATLGISLMAVKSLLNRGRETLRRRLARFLPEGGKNERA